MDFNGRNYEVFKEPRGFIKVLQLIFTIFAFATTCGYNGSYDFTVQCPNATQTPHKFTFQTSYAFRFVDTNNIKVPVCDATNPSQLPLYGDFTGAARFYVFVGVITMLYCLAAIVLYVFFASIYEEDQRVPKADFVISAILVLFWFIAAVAWADGVSKLKEYSAPERIFNQMKECHNIAKCAADEGASYGGLNVSLIFGFTNIALWASSLWFLWKETAWFDGNRADGYSDRQGIGADGSHM